MSVIHIRFEKYYPFDIISSFGLPNFSVGLPNFTFLSVLFLRMHALVDMSKVYQNQNQNQNCLLVIRPRTIIHQDLCLGKLVPSPHKRSKLSN